METFRLKQKGNQLLKSYSHLNRIINLKIKESNKDQRNYHPYFTLNNSSNQKSIVQNQKLQPPPLEGKANTNRIEKKVCRSAHQSVTMKESIAHKNLTSRSITFRKSTTSSSCWFRPDKFTSQASKLNKIENLMNEKNTKFCDILNESILKMNYSYKNFLEETIKNDFVRLAQQRLSQQKNLKIRMETKSHKKIILKGCSNFNESKFREKHTVDDLFSKENNLFTITMQPKKCMDGIFPMFRSGSTLCSIGSSVFLFGGVNSKLANGYHFNQYLSNLQEWICVKNVQSAPSQIPSFHSVQTFKNSLLFIGGSSINERNQKRVFNRQILIYDTDQQQFSRIYWNICLRSHASTIYSNMLVVYGGIDQYNKYSNTLYFLPLNTSDLSLTNPVPYNLGHHGQQIAYHKMVNTFDIDVSLKEKLQMDGIICFGGKFQDGRVNQQLLLFRFIKSNNSNSHNHHNQHQQPPHTQQIIKGWQTVQTHGVKPAPRSCHSMDILYKRCICLIIGGMNSQGQALNDAWILDLTASTWIQVLFDTRYDILQKYFFITIIFRGIFSHATTIMNGEIYVFGGFTGQHRISNQFWSVDFTFCKAAKKQQALKKSRSKIGSSSKLTKLCSKMRAL